MSVTPAIRVRHLWHRFGQRDVLVDVSFDVAPGQIYGFIGPNGAGKTTTIRVMATLLEPTAGRVEIEGHDVSIDPEAVRRLVGYMPDHAGVYERVTVREYLTFFAGAFGVAASRVVPTVVELTELGEMQHRLVAELSKGMRQRLQLARVLLHDPKVLVLDEPASDLDPRARIELRDLLLELRSLGKTIFLSSHILTELADICTSVAILERGRLVVAGPIDEIAQRLGASPHASALDASGEPGLVTAGGVSVPASAVRRLRVRVLGPLERAAAALAGGPGIVSVEARDEWLHVSYQGDDQLVAAVVRQLVAHGVDVVGCEPERRELERIFLEMTQGDRP